MKLKTTVKTLIILVIALSYSCAGGGAGSTGGSSAVKHIFVTSTTTNGDFGGISGGNAICANLATSLGGSWVAILSTSTQNASALISDVGPWYLVDNTTLVASNLAGLFSGTLQHAIDLDETGASQDGQTAWTGSLSNGTYDSANCSDWISSGGRGAAYYGTVSATNTTWATSAGTESCGTSNHLYCIEQ